MQTFLPSSDFAQVARVLDRARLGKQRVETLQILQALRAPAGAGWSRHPASVMWCKHIGALCAYGAAICAEWIGRGYRDTCAAKIAAFHTGDSTPPPWLGDERVHASHRAALRAKMPAHYSPERLGPAWDVEPRLAYEWPLVLPSGGYILRQTEPPRRRGQLDLFS